MARSLLNPIDIVRLLADAPQKIRAATAEKSDAWLAQRSGPEEWSPNEILAHLRACQDTWGDVRMVRMLDEDHPVMRAVNPRTWLRKTNYLELNFHESLEAFRVQRNTFVTRIRLMTPEQWQREGTFTGGGKPRIYSVHTEGDALARHERSHIEQISRLCRG